MIRFTYFILIFVSLTLAACSTKQQDVVMLPLTPMPEELYTIIEPDNNAFITAAQDYIALKKGPPQTQYEFTRIDLDNDGRRDGIILMKTPHQYWCDINGCNMAVFKAHNDGFRLISEVAPVRGPLIVSDNRTNGWHDLIIRVSGRMGWSAKNVALQFDGHSYPLRPEFEKALYASNTLSGTRIFP